MARLRPVTFAEGFTLKTFPDVFFPDWEKAERSEMVALIDNCDVLVDVGANHGFYSVMADHLGKPAIAIEPEETNLAVLRENAKNRRIEVIPIAVGDRAGVITLYGDADIASTLPGWGRERFFRQTVPVQTLDSVIRQRVSNGRLLIKVDVEGAEDAVLAGATETLGRDGTWIIETMEAMPDGRPCPAFDRVFEVMGGAGFKGRLIEGEDRNWIFER